MMQALGQDPEAELKKADAERAKQAATPPPPAGQGGGAPPPPSGGK
jgi:hypothetical protein